MNSCAPNVPHGCRSCSRAKLSKAIWRDEARDLKLDISAFEACLKGGKEAKVKDDVAEGLRIGVNATPTFVIGRVQKDGRLHVLKRIHGAQPYTVFSKEITLALGKS